MNILAQTEATLKEEIVSAIILAKLTTKDEMPDVILEKTRDESHGDFATNIAMQLARIAKKAPRQIAEEIVAHFNQSEAAVEKVEIAGPGFINFFMKDAYLDELIPAILTAGETYGESSTGAGTRIQVEFVSVNPTGDLHLAHGRHAAYGDVLSNILAVTGHDVEREYYINDAGNQIDHLALSIEARYLQALGQTAEIPEDGYHGQDVVEVAEALLAADSNKWIDESEEDRLTYFKDYGLKSMLTRIKQDLADFRVHFDEWFSEKSLYKGNQIPDTIDVLREGDYIYEQGDATWFASTKLGDDKDRVLVKQDGTYTYFTPDITYHKNKFERGFDKLINVWGGDHHGYIPRMNAGIEALGYDVNRFTVKIIQMVNIIEQGEKVRMSKRSGNAVPLRELVEEVGVDAVRYFFISRSNDSQLDFDKKLAQSQSTDNPVYYVQYAHARICTMIKQAEKANFMTDFDYDPSLLVAQSEIDLLIKLASFPQVLSQAAESYTPHHVTQYVYDLAALLHRFYNAEKVLDDANLELTKARIALMKAVRITLQNGLKIIGVTAPESM